MHGRIRSARHRAAPAALSLLALLAFSAPAPAVVLTSSIADFSDVQGQDGWRYGLFDQGPDNTTPYTTGAFVELDVFDVPGTRWVASDGLVGANNNDFLNLGAEGGHPTGLGPGGQDSIVWAVRRYTSAVDELLEIAFDLRKSNVANDRGGGITGRIFVDGVEVFTQFIENDDGTGVQGSLLVDAAPGTLIDFAIDPTGIAPVAGSDGIFSARADGSVFSATIASTPEPGVAMLLAGGLVALGLAPTALSRRAPKRRR